MTNEGESRVSQHPSEWSERDHLFKVFANELFEGHLTERQIEKSRLLKIEGKSLSTIDKASIVIQILLHRITPSKQLARQESLLSQLSADERQAVEVSLGLNMCGLALNKVEVAAQLNLTSEIVDELIQSASEKFSNNLFLR